MNVAGGLLVVLHLVGWAIVLGGALVNIRTGVLAPGMLHGALTALVTGLVLVGLDPELWTRGGATRRFAA